MLFILLRYYKLDVFANCVNHIQELAKCKVLLIEAVRIYCYPALNCSNCLAYIAFNFGRKWQGNCDALS